jgi:hypothetical protein
VEQYREMILTNQAIMIVEKEPGKGDKYNMITKIPHPSMLEGKGVGERREGEGGRGSIARRGGGLGGKRESK